jgi:hypothetical protein
MAAVPLIGAVMPEQIPEVIRARAFQVIDANGNERAAMNPTGISYADENGTVRAGMETDRIGYWGETGPSAPRSTSSASPTPARTTT